MLNNRTDKLPESWIKRAGSLVTCVVVQDMGKEIDAKVQTLRPAFFFSQKVKDDENETMALWPEEGEVIAVPPQSADHVGNPVGAKIVPAEKIPTGWSDAAKADALCCQWPDGEGSWAHTDELTPVNAEAEAQKIFAKYTTDVMDSRTVDEKRKVAFNEGKAAADEWEKSSPYSAANRKARLGA